MCLCLKKQYKYNSSNIPDCSGCLFKTQDHTHLALLIYGGIGVGGRRMKRGWPLFVLQLILRQLLPARKGLFWKRWFNRGTAVGGFPAKATKPQPKCTRSVLPAPFGITNVLTKKKKKKLAVMLFRRRFDQILLILITTSLVASCGLCYH